MPGYRIDRITEDIKRELVHILREVKDPRVNEMLTIVKVDVSSDLSYCKVYVSAVEGIDAAKESVKGLKAASGFIRGRLGSSLKLRKVPELKFVADDSIEKGFELFDKLRSIHIPESSENDEN
ncbi:MAG: 30S ribosome-binding factor RbfA [Eubacterium sp.]|nr:30S ribosome-binding factor RbfA [Eubacterium sp.]MBR6392205.1 30S ribosome-binding factor RbfA [Eubacterium sp.]MBR7072731.1 30S ribosome-binding factor RbfA [Eubacterium sp.]